MRRHVIRRTVGLVLVLEPLVGIEGVIVPLHACREVLLGLFSDPRGGIKRVARGGGSALPFCYGSPPALGLGCLFICFSRLPLHALVRIVVRETRTSINTLRCRGFWSVRRGSLPFRTVLRKRRPSTSGPFGSFCGEPPNISQALVSVVMCRASKSSF